VSGISRSYAYYESPIGLIEIGGTAEGVTWLAFVQERRAEFESHAHLDQAVQQLAEYFNGSRRIFELPLRPEGTEFQRQVWGQLLQVPFGQTASYRDIATAIGRPQAVRAVGAANGRNPISIVVPCHRVLGSNGGLTGYGGGLWRKEWLLRHEGSWPGA
jgi:methylated-DNA-[protein]-cysteine S-methyltransferase